VSARSACPDRPPHHGPVAASRPAARARTANGPSAVAPEAVPLAPVSPGARAGDQAAAAAPLDGPAARAVTGDVAVTGRSAPGPTDARPMSDVPTPDAPAEGGASAFAGAAPGGSAVVIPAPAPVVVAGRSAGQAVPGDAAAVRGGDAVAHPSAPGRDRARSAPEQAAEPGSRGRGAAAGAVRAAVPAIRFAALGDSLTEGLGDPVPGGGWRGWAELLAGAAGPHGEPVDFVNVSCSGALAADVAGEQLTAARRARPHLASVVVGMNDTLRDTFDIRRVTEALDATIGALRADGAVVLTACLPDPGRMLGLPSALARPLGRRMRAVNTVVHALSGRYGAVHVELTEHNWVTDREAWSVDRLHPSELGHRLLAREFHTALTARGIAMGEPPSMALDGQAPSRAASAWWMATRGTRWVVDRCTDLLPGLLALAAQEVRDRARGAGPLLDGRQRRAALAALAALPPKAAVHEVRTDDVTADGITADNVTADDITDAAVTADDVTDAAVAPGTSPPHAATMAG
jgi:lysophospholipase L1-like esterase